MAQEQKIDFEPITEPIDFEPIQPKKEEPGLIDRALNGLHSIDQFFTPAPFKELPRDFVGPIQHQVLGPGMQTIPGVQSAADWLANKIDNPQGEGSYLRGGIAGAIQGLGGLLSVADPRAVGIKPNAPLPQIFEGPLPEVRQVGPRGLLERSTGTGATPRFLTGEAGTAEVGRTYPMDTGPVNPSMMGEGPTGTILQRELGDITQIPADQAARTGLTLGRPETPRELERPIQLQTAPERKLLSRAPFEEPELKLPSETWQDRLPSEMRAPGINPETGRPNIAMGGADRRVLDVLGTSLYTKDRPSVVAKELLQNAIDEMRETGKMGAPVRIVFQSGVENPKTAVEGNAVIVQDQGRGMTPDQLYTVFSDVGKTGKGNTPGASGGFGFAKAAPFLSGEHMQVESVVDDEDGNRVKYTFEGTPSELKPAKEGEITKGVPLKSEYVDEETPTGLKVKVFFPKDKSLYMAKDLIAKTVKNSPGVKNVQVLDDYSGGYRAEKFLKGIIEPSSYLKIHEGEPIPMKAGSLKTSGADIDLHYELDDKERQAAELAILNNGLYAHSDTIRYGMHPIPHVPGRIVANIRPTVEEGSEGEGGKGIYPFPANREGLSSEVNQAINDWIDQNIKSAANDRQKAELQRVYDELQPARGNNFVVLDSGGKYTPEELGRLNKSQSMKTIANVMHDIISDLEPLFEKEALGKTQKAGLLISAPELGGLNVSSPKEKGNYAILVNPFSAAQQTSTPKDMAQRLVHVIMHEFTHNLARSEGADYTWKLSQVYAKYDLERQLNARATILNAITDGKGNYAPEFQNLLQEYLGSRGRPESTTDILSRERSGEWIRKPAEGGTSNNSKPNESRAALNKLITSIKEAKPLREEQEASYSEERGQRIGAYGKVIGQKTGGGLSGFRRALNKLRGPYEKVDASSIAQKMTISEIDSLVKLITAHNLPGFQDPRAKIALLKTINGELPQNNELDLLNRVFGPELPSAIMELHAGVPLTRTALSETAGIAKSLKSSFDFSAPFRQGIALIHTPEFWSAFKDMFALAPSETSYRASQDALKDRPLADFSMKSGLYLADISDKKYGQKEEAYPSRMLSKGKYNPVGFSERAYTAFLNQLRANTFDKLVMEAGKNITDLKDMHQFGKQAAEFVNNATGRGSLDFSSGQKGSFGNFEKSAVELNAAFYSPRLMASRVRMLTKVLDPKFYTELNPQIRKEYLKSLLAIGGFGTIMALAARQLPKQMGKQGADVSLNPTSADFGKIKFGPTRIDPYGGFQQYIVLLNKLVAGQSTSTTSGITRDFGTAPLAGTRYSTLDQFRRNKMSPLAAFGEDWLRGSNAIGEKFQAGPEVLNLFMPMVLQDAVELYKENPDYFWLIGPDALGAGLQTYGQKEVGGFKPLGGTGQLRELSR